MSPRPYTLADWSNANAQAEKLQTLARHAEELGLEAETERLWADAAEMEAEAEHIQLDLIARGIEP